MAFVVRKAQHLEIRESRSTSAGPRATTLATFRVLDDEVLRRAAARAEHAFDGEALRRRARALGAEVAPPDVVLAARQLLVELDRGREPPAALRSRLVHRLGGHAPAGDERVGDALDDAVPWVMATDAERGAALHDLLALTDRLPPPKRSPLRFRRPRVAPDVG